MESDSAKKKKLGLSVIIVEDHNEVLHHMYRAIGSKKIPFNDGIMVHFDSHPDMVVPKTLDPEKIYDKDFVLNSLSIENWIIPAVFAGHFNELVWVKPPWSTQLTSGVQNFKVGVESTTGEIKVTCPESYYVSEGSWCPEKNLKDGAKDLKLQVLTLGSAEGGDSLDTSTEVPSTSELDQDIHKRMSSVKYVLDIDLDFYSTKNPFLELFSQEQFEMLRNLYHYEHPKELTEKALSEATTTRIRQLSELKSIFDSLRDRIPLLQSPLLESVQPLLDTFPDGVPPDPDVLNDAGCTCDDCTLPHHVSSPDEVRRMVGKTKQFLSKLPRPALITIARSSRDDYCPPEDVDFIQSCVIEMLEEVYGSLEINKDYDVEEEKSQL